MVRVFILSLKGLKSFSVSFPKG